MNAPAALINQLRIVGKALWAAGLPVLDDLHNFSYDWKPPANMKAGDKKVDDYKTQKYIDALKQLKTRCHHDDYALHRPLGNF